MDRNIDRGDLQKSKRGREKNYFVLFVAKNRRPILRRSKLGFITISAFTLLPFRAHEGLLFESTNYWGPRFQPRSCATFSASIHRHTLGR